MSTLCRSRHDTPPPGLSGTGRSSAARVSQTQRARDPNCDRCVGTQLLLSSMLPQCPRAGSSSLKILNPLCTSRSKCISWGQLASVRGST